MLPIFPNNNLSVSQVIALACMQGQLLQEGAVCARGGGQGCDALDTFMLFPIPFAQVGCRKRWKKTLGYVEGTR